MEIIFGGWVGQNFGNLVIPKNIDRRFDITGLYNRNEKRIRYTRDENGFRGRYKESSKIDILAVGGSTTNEIFVDDKETWTFILEKLFRKNGINVDVVNGGVDGQSTIGHLANFDYWYPMIPNFQPRYILFFIGINDTVITKSGYLSKQDRLFNFNSAFKQYLLNNSAIYSFFRNIRGTLIAKKANLIHGSKVPKDLSWRRDLKQPNVSLTEKHYANQLITYGQRISLLIERTRNLGAVPIFVTQHDATYRINGVEVYGRVLKNGTVNYGNYSILAAHNRLAMQMCIKKGAICVDLFKKLHFVDGDHYDTVHTTPNGSYKIGKFLFDQLYDKIKFIQ